MRPGELVRSFATAPVETARKIPRAALTRIRRVLEERGVMVKPWDVPLPPDTEEMVAVGDQWGPSTPTLAGIDLCTHRQLELLEQMRRYATDLPDFGAGSRGYRYQPKGSPLPLTEALALHLMLRLLRPNRIVELGSSQGRAVMLDTIERSFEKPIEIGSAWRELAAGDVLYVETREVVPLLFDILPSLSAGVYVQLRPVFYPFRQAHLLRAFLMYNRDFQIRFWPSFLHQHHRDRLTVIPQICADTGALWIRKVS